MKKIEEISSGKKLLLVAILLPCIIGFFLLFYSFLPVISGFVAKMIPIEIEEKVFKIPESFFEDSLCKDETANSLMQEILGKLSSKPYKLYLSNDGPANAFAFPGGSIFVNTQLILEAESADEIAAVLAHELGHLEKRHILGKIVQATFFNFALAALWGDFSTIAIDPEILFNLVHLQFSRSQEDEADDFALQLMFERSFDPEALASFFERQETDNEADFSFFSAHPSHAKRIERARSHPKPPMLRSALSAEKFAILQDGANICQ